MKGGEVITALWTSGFNQLQMWGSVGVFFFLTTLRGMWDSLVP